MAKHTLTEKQLAFCNQVSLGKSGAEAYQIAFKCKASGTSKVNASKLLKMPLIQAEVSRLQQINRDIVKEANRKVVKGIGEAAIIDRARRMHILSQIAEGAIPLNKPMVVGKEIQLIEVVPDYMDRKNAIAELNKMDGEYATEKTEVKIEGEGLPSWLKTK